MTQSRHIFVVLPPAEICDAPQALLHAAAALAQDAPLSVIALEGASSPAMTVQPLPQPARWWQCRHAQLQRLDAASLLACMRQALQHAAVPEQALLLLPPGPLNEACAARLAAQLGASYLGRCVQITPDAAGLNFERPAYGGRARMQLRSEQARCIATWRPGADAAGAEAASVPPELHKVELDTALPALPVTEAVDAGDRLPPLENARLVVSGGRGMQGEEGFALLYDIALALDASLGGSLPAVDAGWVPVARQVGQSGKFVSPKVYFTVGISGTPQHLAGVAADSRIIAVNKDPLAPIFQRAQYGVVAQWQELLPALLKELRSTTTPAA